MLKYAPPPSDTPAEPRTQAEIEAAYAAKIEAAREAAQERRDAAFVEIPFVVAGIPLRPMCLPDFLALIASKNAHVTGQPPPEGADVVAFWRLHSAHLMWAMSPEFSPSPRARQAFIKRVAALPFDRVFDELAEYLRDTFADAPKPRKPDGDVKRDDPLRVSFAAMWVYRLAKRLHWSRAEIRATPLREIWQYFRILDAEDALNAGKHPLPPTDETDRLWGEMLAKINALHT